MAQADQEQLRASIVIHPGIQGGRPIIRGTRVPASRIVGALAAGATADEPMEDYALRDDDIRAALAYAAKMVEETESPAAQRR